MLRGVFADADSAAADALKDAPGTFFAQLWHVLNYRLFTLGSAELTLGVVLKLALLCALVLVGERLIRRKVTMQVLRRTKIDAALQYAIAKISGYVVILIGFYIALNAVGINLNSLTVVAGAIGIGIGFGLQNIIQNFIAGLIILAERPIALGDRVEVGGIAGTVTKIELRATVIVSTDNISTIVPNSNFITNPVTNWSHGDPRVQIRVPFGVAYGSNLDHLRRAVERVGAENADTLADPKPTLYFVSFGDSALNFELGVWTRTMTQSPRSYISAINFGIERALREAKIEIPFPQRDLNLRGNFPAAATPEQAAAVSAFLKPGA
jgi:small-conductance mechanosensitive channel